MKECSVVFRECGPVAQTAKSCSFAEQNDTASMQLCPSLLAELWSSLYPFVPVRWKYLTCIVLAADTLDSFKHSAMLFVSHNCYM